jgi:zinc transport system ATP-binding protein
VKSDGDRTGPFVEMRGAGFGYGRKLVLRDVNLQIASGEFLGLVGPNGVGKTTLARAILGTLRPRRGTVRYAGGRRPRFGYVPQRGQHDPLYPLTAFDIVGMARRGSRILRRLTRADRARVEEALAHVGLSAWAGKMYRDLSGGLQQRTLIARALAVDPEVLVLDEPTSGLDLLSSHAVLALIGELHTRHRLTVILISHVLEEVAATVRSLILLESEGRMEVGPKEKVLTTEKLSRLYGAPVHVHEAFGRAVVVPGKHRPGGE